MDLPASVTPFQQLCPSLKEMPSQGKRNPLSSWIIHQKKQLGARWKAESQSYCTLYSLILTDAPENHSCFTFKKILPQYNLQGTFCKGFSTALLKRWHFYLCLKLLLPSNPTWKTKHLKNIYTTILFIRKKKKQKQTSLQLSSHLDTKANPTPSLPRSSWIKFSWFC